MNFLIIGWQHRIACSSSCSCKCQPIPLWNVFFRRGSQKQCKRNCNHLQVEWWVWKICHWKACWLCLHSQVSDQFLYPYCWIQIFIILFRLLYSFFSGYMLSQGKSKPFIWQHLIWRWNPSFMSVLATSWRTCMLILVLTHDPYPE